MDKQIIVREIIEALEELSTTRRLEMSARNFPTSQRVIGVTNPDMKAVIKALRERNAGWIEQEWIELCKALVKQDIFECQVVAYEMIGRDKKLLNVLTYEDLTALWRNLDNWASVDHFTVGIYGVLWGRGVVKDHHIEKHLKSGNFWDRRVAVVSTVALNLKSRGGRGDTPRTLSVCERVVDERNPMIWKALSWALRELSKSDREAVEVFLEKHGTRMSKQVVREVRHKLDYGTKN
ncbi:MAG: DNA alkylation repair protein [Bacteroidetes bacterium]|nr:DNA alkylation repair protein [Bacteroidota bacterium]